MNREKNIQQPRDQENDSEFPSAKEIPSGEFISRDTTIWLNEPYKPQINASFSLILEVPRDLEKSCEEAKEGSKKTATIHQLAAGRFFY